MDFLFFALRHSHADCDAGVVASRTSAIRKYAKTAHQRDFDDAVRDGVGSCRGSRVFRDYRGQRGSADADVGHVYDRNGTDHILALYCVGWLAIEFVD